MLQASFHVPVDCLSVLFETNVYSGLLSIFLKNWVVCFSGIELCELFVYFRY